MIIAIDGPAASGKGTIARRLAKYYGVPYLDTGKLYREVALQVLKGHIPLEDRERYLTIAKKLNLTTINFKNEELLTEAVGKLASQIAVDGEIRKILSAKQRDFARKQKGVVIDGRDIGTAVLPDAEQKIFITAAPEIRAERRYKELKTLRKCRMSQKETLAAIVERDNKDENRSVSPLKPADDAMILDTSELTIEEAFQKSLELLK